MGITVVGFVLSVGLLQGAGGGPYDHLAWERSNPHAADRETSSLPLLEEHPCPFADEPYGSRVECATLVVPAERGPEADPTEVVRLAVAVIPATGPGPPREDPILYLEGGPGGSSVAWFDYWAAGGWPSQTDRDLILLDQRGTGYSQPTLMCPEYVDDDDSDDVLSLRRCYDRWRGQGYDPATTSTPAHAADAADLRSVMDIEQWNLLGVSYGSRIALRLLADHPQGIRSVVLDSAYPPEVTALLEEVEVAAGAVDALFAACATDPVCDRAYPDLARTFSRAVDRLDADPVRLGGDDHTGDTLVIGVVQALYDPAAIPALPRMITAFDDDPRRALRELLDTTGALGADTVGYEAYRDADGAFYSVECREEAATVDPDEARARAARVRGAAAGALVRQLDLILEICSWWESGVADPAERETVVSGIPTLILTGSLDPVTPPAWARRAAAGLSASTVLEFPAAGHALIAAGPCPTGIIEGFLAEPAGEVDTSCVGANPIAWQLEAS